MRIGIIGTGYVGLVTGVCFAENGNNVVCMDIDARKIARLKKGDPVIYEPQVEELLEKNLDEGRISFTTNLKHTAESSQIIFLCLPTPSNKDGSANISSVIKVTEKLSGFINEYKVIVSKSTVPVGTCEHLKKIIASNCKHDFDVVS